MGDMRERLAKELCRRFSAYSDGRDWEEFLEDVPPLLAILREPDEGMVEAGCESVTGYARPAAIRTAYTAMIDAIGAPARASPSNTPA